MHLIDHNKLAGLCRKKRARIRELGDVSRVLEIEIYRRPLLGELASKRSLSDLSWAKEDDCRLACERVDNPCLRSSSNQRGAIHPCKLKTKYLICKENQCLDGSGFAVWIRAEVRPHREGPGEL